MTIKSVVIVFNPKGGSARGSIVDRMVAAFEAREIPVSKVKTTPEPGSASKLAAEAASSGANLVVAVGGDGTIREVVEGVMGTDALAAAYPGGTGNLFLQSNSSTLTPEAFVAMVANGRPQDVDMIRLEYIDVEGVTHDQWFMTALGLGPLSDAIIISQDVKRVFGKLAYAVNVSKASLLVRPVSLHLQLEDDGGKRELSVKADTLIVANVLPPKMAFMSRGCNASDGLMDVIYVGGDNFFELLPTALRYPLGTADQSRHYGRARTQRLLITSECPVTPNIDGDAGPATTALSLSVVKGAVKMVLV